MSPFSKGWRSPTRLILRFHTLTYSIFALLYTALSYGVTQYCPSKTITLFTPLYRRLSDKKPEDWNIRLRELYPLRQTPAEKAFWILARRLRLAPTQNRAWLPPEIWAIILEDAIRVPLALDTTCEPRMFHILVDRYSSDFDRRMRKRLMELRLVCHTWKTLLTRHTHTWSAEMPSIQGRNVQRVEICVRKKLDYHKTPIYEVAKEEDEGEMTDHSDEPAISPLIMTMRRTRPGRYLLPEEISTIDQMGARLQALTLLENAFVLLAPFFSFSNIRLLSIHSSLPIKTDLRMEGVKILILDANVPVIEHWHLPALIYCSLGRRYNRDAPLPAPAQQIRALDLRQRTGFSLTARSWELYSSLRSLSVTGPHLKVLDSPPSSHPIEHLYFNPDKLPHFPAHMRVTSGQCKKEIGKALEMIPNLRYLTIECANGRNRSYNSEDNVTSEGPWWAQLLDRSRKEGGPLWLDEHGDEVCERSYWRGRPITAWEGVAFVVLWAAWLASAYTHFYSVQLLPTGFSGLYLLFYILYVVYSEAR